MFIYDEDTTLLFLRSLSIYFEYLKDDILHDKEYNIALAVVQMTIRTKKLTKMKYLEIDDNGEGLTISWGTNESKGNKR